MDGNHDLELILRSRTPIIVIESQDEARMLQILQSIVVRRSSKSYTPLFRWTITDGLQRIDISLEPQTLNSEPTDVLRHIRAVSKPAIYVLLDFHPFLEDPVHIRLLKDICIQYSHVARQIVLLSHKVTVPNELESFCARFEMELPSKQDRDRIRRRAPGKPRADRSEGAQPACPKPGWPDLLRYQASRTQCDLFRWGNHEE